MNSTHVAGGPLGVARTDRQRRPRRKRHRRRTLLTVASRIGPILLGATIVEVLAVGLFGLVAGSFFVLLFLATFAVANRWVR